MGPLIPGLWTVAPPGLENPPPPNSSRIKKYQAVSRTLGIELAGLDSSKFPPPPPTPRAVLIVSNRAPRARFAPRFDRTESRYLPCLGCGGLEPVADRLAAFKTRSAALFSSNPVFPST